MVTVVLPSSVAGGQFRLQASGSDLKLLIKLVDAWRFVFGRARRG